MRMAMVTNRGGRESNEDYISRSKKDGKYCFALADGLGGQANGEVASQLAVDTIIGCFESHPEVSEDIIYAYLEAAQNAVIEGRLSDVRNARMGTTIATLLTDGEKAIWAHCGDSRIYRFRKNKLQEITDDHSVAFASFLAGDINYSDIRTSPDQNKLLRSLGDGSKFKPDISEITKVDKKTVFLMCSDGFWEYVDEDFMEKTLKKSNSPREWLEIMIEERARFAPADADNFSAIVVFI